MASSIAMYADDRAIFVEDSLHPVVAESLGASPSGVAMLSPARHFNSAAAPSSSSSCKTSAPPSAQKARRFATDLSNTSGQPSSPCAHVTPMTNRARRYLPASPMVTPHAGAMRAAPVYHHVATSPMPAATDDVDTSLRREAMVPLSEYQVLEAGYDRLAKMYDHLAERAKEAEEQRAKAQQLADSKIVEIISLSSRLEETKRFTKQLKCELRDAKTRTLSLYNAPFSDAARVEATYEERLRMQEEQFRCTLDEQAAQIQKLEDTIDALGVSVSVRDALAESFAARQALCSDLDEIYRQRDASDAAHMEKIKALQAEIAAVKATAALEKKRSVKRYGEAALYTDRLEALVRELQDQLVAAEERVSELECMVAQTRDWEQQSSTCEGEETSAHTASHETSPASDRSSAPEAATTAVSAQYVDVTDDTSLSLYRASAPVSSTAGPAFARNRRRSSPGSLNFDDSDGAEDETDQPPAAQRSTTESGAVSEVSSAPRRPPPEVESEDDVVTPRPL